VVKLPAGVAVCEPPQKPSKKVTFGDWFKKIDWFKKLGWFTTAPGAPGSTLIGLLALIGLLDF
jgi:hypothetical protein